MDCFQCSRAIGRSSEASTLRTIRTSGEGKTGMCWIGKSLARSFTRSLIHSHTCTHTHTHMHSHAHTHALTHILIHSHTCTNSLTHTHKFTFTCIHSLFPPLYMYRSLARGYEMFRIRYPGLVHYYHTKAGMWGTNGAKGRPR